MLAARARELGDKLGPILVQLPPTMRADVGRLRATLEAFPEGWRVAVEFRHDSWYTDEVRALLTQHGAALCLADRFKPLTPIWRTADWTYLRFHAGRATPLPCYGRQALATITDDFEGTHPVPGYEQRRTPAQHIGVNALLVSHAPEIQRPVVVEREIRFQ